LKALVTILLAVLISFTGTSAALAWGCKLFDGVPDYTCPPHPDYVTKRINFFCGENPRHQFRHSAGDCRRDGPAFSLRQFTYRGLPAVRWNVQGRKSQATLATGCFCVIDE
jgi:hypothetical protein